MHAIICMYYQRQNKISSIQNNYTYFLEYYGQNFRNAKNLELEGYY